MPPSSAGRADGRQLPGAAALDRSRGFAVLGVVHLLPLPGGPRPSAGLDVVLGRALADARAIAEGGASGLVLENFGDAPFPSGRSGPHVVAAMARIGARIRAEHPDLTLGINVLRNDGDAALAIAAAVGAAFVRVNVLSGATWTDQGLIQGQAHSLLQYRRSLGLDPLTAGERGVHILADVLVKHGVPAGETDPERVAEETAARAGADGLIVTGTGTGAPTDLKLLAQVVEACPGVPVLVGSGTTPSSIAAARAAGASGAIVGTYLHADSRIQHPVDIERVQAVVAAAR